MNKPVLVKGSSWWHKHSQLPLVIGKVYAESDDREAESDDFTAICHIHDHPELVIVHGGTAMHSFKGKDYPISAGDVFCILGEQEHYFHEMHQLQLLNVMYDPVGLNLPIGFFGKIPGYNAMFRLEPNHREKHEFSSRLTLHQSKLAHSVNLVESMYTELLEQPPGFEVSILGGLIRLITFLSRHYGEHSGKKGSALLRIGEVLILMENDPEKPWSLEELAECTHLSPTNFIHTFKQATGVPPLKYLIQLRIRQSMELLAGTDMTVTEIAFECGFNDSNYFARQFKSINGINATEFRARCEMGGVFDKSSFKS
ncbi:MAG: AraC family transcriptional regulator [Verrucomicrobiota bacterium]